MYFLKCKFDVQQLSNRYLKHIFRVLSHHLGIDNVLNFYKLRCIFRSSGGCTHSTLIDYHCFEICPLSLILFSSIHLTVLKLLTESSISKRCLPVIYYAYNPLTVSCSRPIHLIFNPQSTRCLRLIYQVYTR